MTTPHPRPSRNWWKTGVVFLIAFSALQVFDLKSADLSPEKQDLRSRNATASVQIASTSMALAAGELPGYTGWARPERTLAGYFEIMSVSSQRPRTGEEFFITVQCQGNEDCLKGTSMFYLRAYGPSVIPGIVKNEGEGVYAMKFLPMDPGRYTVEVVLTFSNPPSLDTFPINEPEPAYEGYLLPGFPLQISVQDSSHENQNVDSKALCTLNHLTETSPYTAVTKARWKVTSKSNGPGYTSGTLDSPMSKAGYKHNVNSLGIHMDYEYVSHCTLLPRSAFAKRLGNNHPFAQCGKNIQVIFIGDSVMRVQKDMFEGMANHLPNIHVTYIDLYGGYRRVDKLGPNIQVHLDDIQRRVPNDAKVILFNTGLHDIHRLCGDEWRNDRYEYLEKEKLESGRFSCTQEYRLLLQDFTTLIQNVPADLKIFQSTTAAWPKYGNFNIEWPDRAQVMPVALDVVTYFNEIAFEVLERYRESIQIVDGYWITYSRPDNREIGGIGQKLSHPGLEVQSVTSRIWAMLILEKLCKLS